jgi:cytochrome c-type biogenesis protein CcmF
MARGIRARGVLHGERGGQAFVALFRRNGRRYGGYVVHLGVVLIAVAIAASQSGTVEVEQTLAPGGSMAVAGRVVTLDAIRDVEEPQRLRVVADVRVSGPAGDTRLEPSFAFYPNATQPVGTPGISAGAGEDVYVILAAYDQRGRAWATMRARVIPLVSWLWVGGAVIGLGSVLAALPPPRRRPVRSAQLAETVAAGAE